MFKAFVRSSVYLTWQRNNISGDGQPKTIGKTLFKQNLCPCLTTVQQQRDCANEIEVTHHYARQALANLRKHSAVKNAILECGKNGCVDHSPQSRWMKVTESDNAFRSFFYCPEIPVQALDITGESTTRAEAVFNFGQ